MRTIYMRLDGGMHAYCLYFIILSNVIYDYCSNGCLDRPMMSTRLASIINGVSSKDVTGIVARISRNSRTGFISKNIQKFLHGFFFVFPDNFAKATPEILTSADVLHRTTPKEFHGISLGVFSYRL